MKGILIALFSISTQFTMSFVGKEKSPLDAKTFEVEVQEIRTSGTKPKPKPGKISFKYGKVSSKYIKEKTAFGQLSYVIMHDTTFTNIDEEEEHKIEFRAEAVDARSYELTWHGTVINESINAEVVVSKNGLIKKRFELSGEVSK